MVCQSGDYLLRAILILVIPTKVTKAQRIRTRPTIESQLERFITAVVTCVSDSANVVVAFNMLHSGGNKSFKWPIICGPMYHVGRSLTKQAHLSEY